MLNLSSEILRQAESNPTGIALVTEMGNYTYSDLKRHVIFHALRLQEHGVHQDSIVAIFTKSQPFAFFSILAIGLLGASWVEYFPKIVKKDYHDLDVTHILTVGDWLVKRLQSKTDIKKIPVLTIDDVWLKSPLKSAETSAEQILGPKNQTDIWMYAQTSGTTGRPKLMGLTYANYFVRNKKALLTHDFTPVITANLFPALSAPWVSYNLRTLILGGTLVLGFDFKYFVKHKVQKVFGSAIQFVKFFNLNKEPTDKLPIAHVAGSILNQSFAALVLERFEKIHNFYGATEVGGISRKVIEKVADITEPNSCVGKILQGNEVKIVDDGGEALPPGKEGQIAVRNNITLTRYLNQSPNDKSLHDGWFYPGDIGYLDQEGELYIVARERDIVNVGGMKVNVNDYDRIIKSHPMVEDGICFAMNINQMYPEIIALIKLKAIESPRTFVSKLKDYLDKAISLGLPKIARVYFSEDLPVTSNGKINRKDLEQFTANLKPFNLR